MDAEYCSVMPIEQTLSIGALMSPPGGGNQALSVFLQGMTMRSACRGERVAGLHQILPQLAPYRPWSEPKLTWTSGFMAIVGQ